MLLWGKARFKGYEIPLRQQTYHALGRSREPPAFHRPSPHSRREESCEDLDLRAKAAPLQGSSNFSNSLNSLYSSFMSGACTPIRRRADTPIRSKYVCR